VAKLLDTSLFSVIDTDSSLGVGWKLNFYVTGTSTRLDTYPTEADAIAATNANANPVVLAADSRLPAIWITADAKGVLTDENDVVKETVDPISVADGTDYLLVKMTYEGTPGAQGWMGGEVLTDAVTFPINFAGSKGSVETNPAAEFEISIRKNGVEIGTATISTSGAFTFATTGGTTQAFVEDDKITFIAPDAAGTPADITMTLEGTLQ
jgi:hypothetical protein